MNRTNHIDEAHIEGLDSESIEFMKELKHSHPARYYDFLGQLFEMFGGSQLVDAEDYEDEEMDRIMEEGMREDLDFSD